MGAINDSVGKCKNGGIFPSRCGISTTFRAQKSENIPPKVAFPNRVIYRAHRRFIGPWCRFSCPHYIVNHHYRAHRRFIGHRSRCSRYPSSLSAFRGFYDIPTTLFISLSAIAKCFPIQKQQKLPMLSESASMLLVLVRLRRVPHWPCP